MYLDREFTLKVAFTLRATRRYGEVTVLSTTATPSYRVEPWMVAAVALTVVVRMRHPVNTTVSGCTGGLYHLLPAPPLTITSWKYSKPSGWLMVTVLVQMSDVLIL